VTHLQETLRQRLDALYRQPALWSTFAQAWADERGGEPAADAGALLDDCLQQEPLDIIENLLAVAAQLGERGAAPGAVPEVVRRVAIDICLVVCERRIHDRLAAQHIAAAAAASEELLIDASEQLAAALIAAACCRNGVRIHFDGQTRRAEAVNVVRDLPPQELDFQGPRECVKVELQALVKTPLDDLATGKARALHDIRQYGVASDDVLLAQLRRYARTNDCRPMFGLDSASAHPLDDAALRQELAGYFDVATFHYGDAAGRRLADADRAAWQRANLQADLMSYLPALLAQLSAPQASAGARLQNTVSKCDFFISYNKADKEWAEWIAWQVEDAGYSTLIQAWDFHAGGNFVLDMDRAMKQTERTIAVLSPDYLAARYTQPEWAAALLRDPAGAQRRLIPVRVAHCELDGLLAAVTHVDLVGLDQAPARKTLLDRISGERLKPSREPRFPGAASPPPRPEPSFPGS